MPRRSNYDKFPFVPVTDREEDCQVGWAAVARQLDVALTGKRSILCVECYPGTNLSELESGLASVLKPRLVVRAEPCLKSAQELDAWIRKKWPTPGNGFTRVPRKMAGYLSSERARR